MTRPSVAAALPVLRALGDPRPAVVSAEAAMALPMPLHQLVRDENGRSRAACDAPVGSVCRMGCAEDCGAEVWPCGGYDYEADRECEPHPMGDVGECNVVLYLNAENPDDLFSVEGDPDARTYSGPIQVAWENDTYVWEPAEGSGTRIAPRCFSCVTPLDPADVVDMAGVPHCVACAERETGEVR
jgi:hypothetical protein